MPNFMGSKKDAVQFVNDLLTSSKEDLRLIMIISQEPSGVYSVSTATDMLSEDIVRVLGQACYDKLINI